VSSSTQDFEAQVERLRAAGCERVYAEKASGKSTNGRSKGDRMADLAHEYEVGEVTISRAIKAPLEVSAAA
jgi:DNA invertase Pin-like site-specific DNA recombinase